MGLGIRIYVIIGIIVLFAIGILFALSTNKQINEMEI